MNEKIKQLWDNSIEEFSKQHQYATIMLPEPLREKFAELIVRECMKLNSKELSITAIERLLPLYREHFGVGE